jgi:hypothetical protein
MSKKRIAVIGGGIATVLGSFLITVFLVGNIGNDTTPPKSQAKVPETFLKAQSQAKADTTYTDPSGFSFQYPNDIQVTDTTPSDPQFYTQLTLSKDANSILIVVRDSPKTQTYPDLAGATTLGGLAAKQYIVADRLITIAYDQGVLYTVDAPSKDIYMNQAYDLIVSTFAFAGQSSASSTDAIYEEETVE